MKELNIPYFHFIISLEEIDFDYTKARQTTDKIYTKIGHNCLEFTSNNDEFIIVKSSLTLNKLQSKLMGVTCKIHAIGNKTGFPISCPILN